MLAATTVGACYGVVGTGEPDSGTPRDAGASDAGLLPDAGGSPDSGPIDGGATPDSGASDDAGSMTDAGSGGTDGGSPADGGMPHWVMGYWAVWQANRYPLANVKWVDLTHIALAFVLPRAPTTPTAASPYPTLDTSNAVANLGANGMAAFASAAHAAGVKAIMSLGGSGAGAGFAAAASSTNRSQFVADVVAACAQWGYDGVDVDWEDSINYTSFQALIPALRSATPAGFLLTAPVGSVNTNFGISSSDSALWTAEYSQMNQLNVMTYTGTGNYSGWVVWYLDPLTGHGSNHPVDVEASMSAWHALGIPKSMLGVGVGFYGLAVGPPVTAALQSFGTASFYVNDDTLSYGNIVRYFYGQGGASYQWDASAQTGWLSWPSGFHPSWTDEYPGDPGPTVQFMSYEDPASVAAKGQWVRANGYGGTIIWTINEGTQFPFGADGYANPLLDSVAQSFLP